MCELLIVYALLAQLKLKSAIICFFGNESVQFVSLVDRVKLSSLNIREDKYLFMIDDSITSMNHFLIG